MLIMLPLTREPKTPADWVFCDASAIALIQPVRTEPDHVSVVHVGGEELTIHAPHTRVAEAVLAATGRGGRMVKSVDRAHGLRDFRLP